MSLKRIQELAGITEAASYNVPAANHAVKPGGEVVKAKNEMKAEKLKTSTKTGDQSGNGDKKAAMLPDGEVVKDCNHMEMTKFKSGKGNTATKDHKIKVGGKVVKEWAQQIVEAGDVEGTIRDLIEALQAAGVEI